MQQTIAHINNRLLPYYPQDEIHSLTCWIVEETTGMNYFEARRTDMPYAEACRKHDTKSIPNLDEILEKLCNYVPVQYIFGHTLWLGMDLRVTEATLIPRPETAELVEHVSHRMLAPTGRLLDIGTGSGCIALALKRRHPGWQVAGLDISSEALNVARENAVRLGLDVQFLLADIFATNAWAQAEETPYDIVISNPPYIRPSERSTMSANALRNEPYGALFVPEDDPLRFYRRIIELHPAPEVWFEINETMGKESLTLLQTCGYDAVCIKDMYGKDRIVYGTTTQTENNHSHR